MTHDGTLVRSDRTRFGTQAGVAGEVTLAQFNAHVNDQTKHFNKIEVANDAAVPAATPTGPDLVETLDEGKLFIKRADGSAYTEYQAGGSGIFKGEFNAATTYAAGEIAASQGGLFVANDAIAASATVPMDNIGSTGATWAAVGDNWVKVTSVPATPTLQHPEYVYLVNAGNLQLYELDEAGPIYSQVNFGTGQTITNTIVTRTIQVASPTDAQVITVDLDTEKAWTSISTDAITSAGTCTVTLNDNGVAVTGGPHAVTDTASTTTYTGQTIAAGRTVTLVISLVTGATDLVVNVKYTRDL